MEIARDAERSPERRARLSRERILRAGVDLADERGLEALSMRKLGRRLGVEAMSLYNHVASKDELLDGMVDLVYAEIAPPSGGGEWKSDLRRVARSAREALARHPWAIALMESRARPGPANLRHHDRIVGRLRDAGFSIELAVHAFSTLDSYVYGFALQEQTLPFDTPEEMAEVGESMLEDFPGDEYPHLAETIGTLTSAGYRFADEFEFGLELVLDGLEQRRAAARGAP